MELLDLTVMKCEVIPARALSCLAGAMPLALYARMVSSSWRNPLHLRQALGVVAGVFLLTAILSWSLRLGGAGSFAVALRHGSLMAASAQTTSGFSTLSVADLSAFEKALLLPGMFVGGCVGSTAGGIKILRLLLLLRIAGSLVHRSGLARHAVHKPRLGGHPIEESDISAACAIFALYAATAAGSWLIFLAYDIAPLDALFDVVSAIGTVGLSTGVTHPELPAVLKLVLCADMWLGRLEILAWIVLLSPRTWIGKRTEVT